MSEHIFKILIVDDEQHYCDVLSLILKGEGHHVSYTTKATDALDMLEKEFFDLVLSDFFMQDMNGFDLLKEIKKDHSDTEVIIITGYGSIKNAVEAMKKGAFSYYIKSHDPEELIFEVEKVKRISELKMKISQPAVTGQYLMQSKNPKMKKAIDLIDKVAVSNANILLLGESGVGKEAFAAYIHEKSTRKGNNFVPVNCHAYSMTLLESELFGHEKGAYTGATETRIGKFESADGGTLFLDEIGDATADMQLKMLRVLDTKRIERIGSNQLIDVNFRLVCATNRKLDEMIAAGEFREDFFYRISTFTIEIPPLRERKEDIIQMVHFFVSKLSNDMKKPVNGIDDELLVFLKNYDFPGNIRELKNMIERLIVLSGDGILRKEDLFLSTPKKVNQTFQSLKEFRKNQEKSYIHSVLKANNQHLTKSAEILGITRRQLFNKIQELEIEIEK
ncbi:MULTISPECIES: sigma-54 dependent transcriptional regulator [unclassified Fusibacter]|uniref:sigma-54-dependent transcriptional regulator n=1 Tax=unclassified Fusibacter TaxID=2624464 RepID=UPI0010137430|nr:MULTISPECIES: sigma-54 dependent transcriptional regulator [unclassified Fusibacter]MCK8059102.1 sigma-54 dependent transcriptional regulator [Fusibacter sp. A2]NPE22511.1 sigma-54-dependent Fis family transcriptional regulator [Fusibacter sp. A1]RXV60614.1 sigma-54-dependent Fis family transcriptional regulator [Fusibacter sp. A1]